MVMLASVLSTNAEVHQSITTLEESDHFHCETSSYYSFKVGIKNVSNTMHQVSHLKK